MEVRDRPLSLTLCSPGIALLVYDSKERFVFF